MSIKPLFKGNTSPSITDTITVNGVAFDLTGATVRFRMRDDDSSTLLVDSPATVVSAPAGTVRYDWASLDTATAGDFTGWWRVTLAGGAIQETPEFAVSVVEHGAASGTLATLEDVRREMNTPDNDVTDDDRILSYLDVASQAIMNEYEREFAPITTATRTIDFDRSRIVDLAPWDLQSVSAVTLDPESAAPITLTLGTDYVLRPVVQANGVYTSLRLGNYLVPISGDYRFRFGYSQLAITGTWGFPSVPGPVKQACVLTVASWLRRDFGNFDVQDLVGGRTITPDTPINMSIPPAARRLLQPYRRSPFH
jgi:hypothetical protein